MTDTIVIVDDEPHLRSLLEQTLEDLEEQGVQLLTAADGGEGWALIEQHKPCLVFLDIMMPVYNGFELCAKIRNSDQLRHTTVALLTARGQEIDKQQGAEIGADYYITKPFDPREVVHLAEYVLATVHTPL